MGFLAHSTGHSQRLIAAGDSLEPSCNLQRGNAGDALIGPEDGVRHGCVKHCGDKTTLNHVARVTVVERNMELKHGLWSVHLNGHNFATQEFNKRRCVFIQSSDDLVGISQCQGPGSRRGRNSNAKRSAVGDVECPPAYPRELAAEQFDGSVFR